MLLNFFGDFVVFKDSPVLSSDLRTKLTEADYNLTNFEAPIHTNAEKAHKSGPVISQNTKNPQWLINNGFNAISLSNNHILDYGKEGYHSTKEAFNKIPTIGCGTWSEAFEPLILEQDGLIVAVFALGELQFGYLSDEWTQKEDIGCAWINHPCVNKAIVETRKSVDYIIVIAHAGLEMVTIPLPEWRDRYRELIDLGCDAIIGGHPHVPQGYEVYQGKPIFYSLGNFCFSSLEGFNSKWWNIGEFVTLNISKDNLEFEVRGVEYIDDRLELIEDSRWNSIVVKLNSDLSTANYMPLVNEICKHQLKEYWSLCNMGGLIHPDGELPKSIARHLLHKYDHIHLLNLFQCESHRWCISRALKLENTAIYE